MSTNSNDSTPLVGAYDSDIDSFSYEIIRGMPYRFRYRATNVNGWGPFSPITTIYAASRPISPLPVTLISSDTTQLTLKVNLSTDNRGLPVDDYRLYIDEGAFDSAFSLHEVLDATDI